MIVLGIDGGASKTHAVLLDENGHVLGVGRAGCSNWEVVDLDGAQKALQAAIAAASRDAGIRKQDIDAGGYGLAGLDWPSDRGRLQPLIDVLGVGGLYTMVNDAFLPLRAGAPDGVGLAAIAGSGTTVVGRNRAGETARSFGASYPFTDWGGAWDIAAAAVYAVAQMYMDLGPDTVLAERMLTATESDNVAEMLEQIMRWQIRVGGDFCPQVFEAAHAGDAVARSIVRRAGETIGANALAIARRLGMLETRFEIVTAGGVFSSQSQLLNKSLLETLRTRAPQAGLTHWQSPPVVGALFLALDLLNLDRLPSTSLVAERVVAALQH